MPEPADGPTGDLDPHEAFQLFSHELRLDILIALWESPEYSLGFSALRRAVDERDSGKFTYHLEQLTDRFVRRDGDRYVLQYAGHRVIDAVRSGVFHESPSVGPVELPGSCPHCDAQPTFEYEDHLATVACPACSTKLLEYPFDPGGFQGRTELEAVEAFDRRTRFKWRIASAGVCFVCAGRVAIDYVEAAPALDHLDRYDDYFAADHPAVLELDCRNCSFYSYVPVGVRILDTPTAVAELANRGVDVADRPLWELPFVVDGERVTTQETEPWTVTVEAPTPRGPVTVRLDETATVRGMSARL